MEASAGHPPHGIRSGCWLAAAYAASLTIVFLGTTEVGLWEDGYFVKRFAYNLWQHGSFAWNPADGPIYGMTSQLLQLLGTALYALAPQHMVLGLKASLYMAALGCLLVLTRIARRQGRDELAILPAVVALSSPLLLEVAQSGLETTLAAALVAGSAGCVLGFARAERSPSAMAAWLWLVYLARPDAVLIPGVLLLALSGHQPRRLLRAALPSALGFGLLWLAFRAYYGTALPLPFYLKTQALAGSARLDPALFAAEKVKNASQFAFFALPLLYIALHERSREVIGLLASGLALVAYHAFATVETMGHHSRFYLPALVPIALAASLVYPRFLQRRSWPLALCGCALYLAAFVSLERLDQAHQVAIMLDGWRYYPYLGCCALLLLTPVALRSLSAAAVVAALLLGAFVSYPVHNLRFEDDETILLRQIAPRRVFRGLAKLRERLPVHALFHTDMGAPGMLFPEARVIDLDGLLNEDVTLRHRSFEALCNAERPEAIFVPKPAYVRLRREVLESQCLHAYSSVERVAHAPHLMLRNDLLARYRKRSP